MFAASVAIVKNGLIKNTYPVSAKSILAYTKQIKPKTKCRKPQLFYWGFFVFSQYPINAHPLSPKEPTKPSPLVRHGLLLRPAISCTIFLTGKLLLHCPCVGACAARAVSCAASNAALHSDNLTFSSLICSSFAESCASLRSNSFCNIEISTVSEVS